MDYEYAPLRLPSNVDRLTAAAQLSIQAEFSEWELASVRLFRDGTRQVKLRRRVQGDPRPGLSY
jgi:stress response protein SCP2